MAEKAERSIGNLLVIEIDGFMHKCIAEITSLEPFRVKAEDRESPYKHLSEEDITILEKESIVLQKYFEKDDQEGWDEMLGEAYMEDRAYYSGLKRLGVENGVLTELLPSTHKVK